MIIDTTPAARRADDQRVRGWQADPPGFIYSDAADLARRVRRRLEQIASEALSPWVKLGDYVFRADEIVDQGATISVRARVSDEIAYQLESMRDNRYGNRRIRFVSRNRVA